MMRPMGERRRLPVETVDLAGSRKAVRALLAGYWSFGQFWGVWVILVFEFQRAHGVTDAGIGLDYALIAIVALGVMLLIAPRLQPIALSSSLPIALGSMAVATIAIGYLPTPAILVGFALLGVGNALVDVYLNVAGQRIEMRINRPVLQWIHATYSLGGVTGAAVAGAIRAAGLDYRLGFACAGVCLAFTTAWTAAAMSRDRHDTGTRALFSVSALFRSPALLVPATVVLAAFLIEGSMDAWSGLYLRGQLGATATVAALAFVAFAAAMFLGRLFASRILFGLGRRTTIVVAGVGSLIGASIATVANSPFVVGVGFLVLGFTLSAAAPAAFGLAGDAGADPVHAISAVTTVGYTGFVWSPPLLGWVAQAFSLRAVMGVLAISTLGIVAGGVLAPRERRLLSRQPGPRRSM
jgi:fucose permease